MDLRDDRDRARPAPPALDHVEVTAALDELAETVTPDFSAHDVLCCLAGAALRVLDVDGAGVMEVEGADRLRFVHATSASAADLERLQERLSAGPCHACHRSRAVVQLAGGEAPWAWPLFQRRAAALGIGAVASVPLLSRGRNWGALDLYRRSAHPLRPEELALAGTLAKVAASYVVMAADRAEVRRAHDELARRAMHDPLTDLPVRWVFVEQLAHALSWLPRRPGHVGVLFVDVDGLKHVNDTQGHGAGDLLLRECATRLVGAVRPTDVVARMGGDEFVVLLEEVSGPGDAAAIAGRVTAALDAPLHLDGAVVQPSASIGVATTADPQVAADTLIAHADTAMYRAKRRGRGLVAVFDAAEHADADAEGTRSVDLARVVDQG